MVVILKNNRSLIVNRYQLGRKRNEIVHLSTFSTKLILISSFHFRFIRFIYNSVILEDSAGRAAAVSALAHFGAACEDLLPDVLVLLQRSLMDTDDEVRDRATFFYSLLTRKHLLNNHNLLDGLQVLLFDSLKASEGYYFEGNMERTLA